MTPAPDGEPARRQDESKPLEARAVFSGVRWTGAGTAATEVVRFGLSIVLANLLAPEDFGLLAMAMVVTGFVMIFQYAGTAAVIIQRKQLTPKLTNAMWLLNTGLSLVLSLAMIAAAPWIADLYDQPDVIPVIQLLTVSFFLMAAGTVPGALLSKEMRFDIHAQIQFVTAVGQALTAMILAWLGYGVWALVWSNIVNAAVMTGLLFYRSGFRPGFSWPRNEVREVIGYCANLTGVSIVDILIKDADKFIIGKWLGDRVLGFYTMAFRFCLYPPLSISPIINRVLFPAFSKLQDDNEQLEKILLRAVGGIAVVTFPMMAGIMVIAEPFVLGVLSEKWAPAIPLMIYLAPVGIFMAIEKPPAYVLMAKGKANWTFWQTIVSGIVIISAFMIGLSWGITGVVIAYSIVALPLALMRFALAFYLMQRPLWHLARALWPYALGALIMAGLVLLTRLGLASWEISNLVELAILVPIGAIVYTTAMLLLKPPAVYDFINLLPGVVRKPVAALAERFGIRV